MCFFSPGEGRMTKKIGILKQFERELGVPSFLAAIVFQVRAVLIQGWLGFEGMTFFLELTSQLYDQ